ncbi:MAG: AarF/ABC1/UbiB kinase family protein [Acidobacteria bacterium]|nr:AarF/ABC1/UbiB kinase family protein [Acidobacteriota bacterium]
MSKRSLKFNKKLDPVQEAANAERAYNAFMKLLALAPDELHGEFFDLLGDEDRLTNLDQTRERLNGLISQLDLESNRKEIVDVLLELIPVEELVPEVYQKYKPMVVDAGNIILSRLSRERLQTKLVEQLMTPLEASVQERLLTLIARMPTLQKLGQIIARNHNLDPEFRHRLQELENSIRDVTHESIVQRVQEELKSQIESYKIKVSPRILAEASVCAVVPFTWKAPGGERKRGVFKVLKPFIMKYWEEELKTLEALAIHFDHNRASYGLPTVGFKELLREVRDLLKREVKLHFEQERLRDATRFYSDHADVRVPELLPMRTKAITGMEFLSGMKVTIAAKKNPHLRDRIAQLVIDKLILSVIFYPQEEALFHADPHAGNLFYEPETDELALFDWGLSCLIDRETRRFIVQLILGFFLRDAKRVFKSTCKLTTGKQGPEQQEIIRRKVQEIIDELPLFPLVRIDALTRLLDELILEGIRFPAALLMFRKSLFTIIGVIHDVDSTFHLDWHVTRYLLGQIIGEIPERLRHMPWSREYPSQISTWELQQILFGLSRNLARVGLVTTQFLAELGLDWAGDVVSRFLGGTSETMAEAPAE